MWHYIDWGLRNLMVSFEDFVFVKFHLYYANMIFKFMVIIQLWDKSVKYIYEMLCSDQWMYELLPCLCTCNMFKECDFVFCGKLAWFCTLDAPFMFSWKFNHNTLIYLTHVRLLFHWNMKNVFLLSLWLCFVL